MEPKDILSLIFTLREDVWKQWGYVITVNLAMWGWLIQRHGLYSKFEKIVATVGYTIFIIIILQGMNKAYHELDLAANELHFVQQQEGEAKREIAPNGITSYFVYKSPTFAAAYKLTPDSKKSSPAPIPSFWQRIFSKSAQEDPPEPKPYSENLKTAFWSIFVGWLFSMILFWVSGFWNKARSACKEGP